MHHARNREPQVQVHAQHIHMQTRLTTVLACSRRCRPARSERAYVKRSSGVHRRAYATLTRRAAPRTSLPWKCTLAHRLISQKHCSASHSIRGWSSARLLCTPGAPSQTWPHVSRLLYRPPRAPACPSDPTSLCRTPQLRPAPVLLTAFAFTSASTEARLPPPQAHL